MMPQQMPPQMPQGGQSPQQNPNMQMFMQMLQQQGYPLKSNLQGLPQGQPPQGQPPQGQPGMQPPAGMPPQGMPPGMPPQQGQSPQGMPPGMPQQGQGGAPPQQQIPPQLLAMLQQHQQQMQQQGGRPGMPQQGQQQGSQQPGKRFTPQELAALGRMGDTTVAHLTPGEIAVPPQVQTPKVLATLKHAFKEKGAPPQNFVAGSPSSSINPSTGMPEYNFWSSALPIALGIGGTLLAPGIGTMLGSTLGSAALGAIGGGLGTTLGGLATGASPMQALGEGALGGLGAYGGGYLAGQLGDIGGSAASSGSDAVNSATATGAQGAANNSASQLEAQNLQGELSQSALENNPTNWAQQAGSAVGGKAGTNAGNSLFSGQSIGQALGNAAGTSLGSSIFSPSSSGAGTSSLNGFNTPYKNASQLPPWQTQIGQTGYTGPTPNFTGYNPATNYPASYNFFPTGQQNQVPQA